MNNFGEFLTPEEVIKGGDTRLPKVLKELSSSIDELCMVCEREGIWRYAGTRMCFSCTTGEADASDDIELISSK